MDRGVITYTGNAATVRANNARPLEQAIEAVREQYGWTVDFEDPPYESAYDLVDSTDPQWRKEHPTAKGVRRIAGGLFTSTFFVGKGGIPSSDSEQQVLEHLVNDYNESGNPGRFAVRSEGPRRYAVVGAGIKDSYGNEKKVAPVLDDLITLPKEKRTLGATIQTILRMLSEKSGFHLAVGVAPLNLLFNTEVEVGGDDIPARDLLIQVLAASKRPLIWRMFYDADMRIYFVNIEFASQIEEDSAGRSILKPIRKP
jgi:hypothetical protein